MARPHAPWWMIVLAASYVTTLGFEYYCDYFGVEPPGIRGEFSGQGMLVRTVAANSPAERQGLRPGDLLVAMDGQPVRNKGDWIALCANLEVGRAHQWQMERAGQPIQVTYTPARISFLRWPAERQISALMMSASRIATLALAFIIAFSRPQDLVARLGALFLAMTAILGQGPPPGAAVAWRSMPLPVGVLLFIPPTSLAVGGAILFTFFANFPRKLFRARWLWIVVWAPQVIIGLGADSYFYQMTYGSGVGILFPYWAVFVMVGMNAALTAAGLAALVVNYRRLEEVNERRRLRLIVAGAVVSWLPAVWLSADYYMPPGPAAAVAPLTQAIALAFPLFYLAFPVSLAHAILRHRLFDIRVMVRQGLQYALARRVVVSAGPAVAALLLLDLLAHRDQPPVTVLRARGWFYVVLGGLALVVKARRQAWLEALDRRFFRERYDAQRLLREVIEDIRQAGSFERVAARVVAQVDAALHPEFAAILVREPPASHFRTLASAPAGQAPPALDAGSKLMALLRVLSKPLEISLTESSWLKQQLPHQDTEFLRRARLEWLVPISLAPDRAEALLVLGPKRSEEPYSRDDQDLLATIATSLSLLPERPAESPRASESFQECPQCGTCYDSSAARCQRESAALQSVRLPRVLAGRYRIEQRLGRGGMGTVYEATDTALERQVAVKVLREELLGSRDAADRFQREARVAARFSHPNVVTIHDFGIVAETRAFLVMERLHGVSLRQELQARKRLAPERLLGILRGVCAAVEAGHRQGLIHRDLKPENIFLVEGETDWAKVLDFGVAKFLPSATSQSTVDTSPGVLVGTLQYMSPEQLRGQEVQAGWDLWALAVVAYEALAGELPFPAATAAEWHGAVLAGRFTPLARHLPEAPGPWQQFFERAFAADPGNRPASAQSLFSEVERALGKQ